MSQLFPGKDKPLDKHQATPDQTGKLFDNPQVEQADDAYYMHFPGLEEALADEYFNLMGYFF
jgi:hypothetical protein